MILLLVMSFVLTILNSLSSEINMFMVLVLFLVLPIPSRFKLAVFGVHIVVDNVFVAHNSLYCRPTVSELET